MSNPTITFLTGQIKKAEADVEAIDLLLASNPPETTDQLLMLREAQNEYRAVIRSLRAAIDCCE